MHCHCSLDSLSTVILNVLSSSISATVCASFDCYSCLRQLARRSLLPARAESTNRSCFDLGTSLLGNLHVATSGKPLFRQHRLSFVHTNTNLINSDLTAWRWRQPLLEFLLVITTPSRPSSISRLLGFTVQQHMKRVQRHEITFILPPYRSWVLPERSEE